MAFNPAWITAGASAAGTLYSMFGGGSNRQMENSEKLMDYQYNLNNKAMREQEAAQLRMFENTGYAARVDQLKRAGLNPALIYGAGASGGGGVTGNIAAPSVSGQQAPNQASFDANKLTVMGMGLQLAKLKSEIQVNEATAQNLLSNVPVNTNKAPNIEADTELLKSQKAGQDIANDIAKINLLIKDQTKFASIEEINSLAESAHQKALQEINKTEISNETKETIIKQYNADLANTIANTAVAWSQRKLNEQEVTKLKAEVLNIGKQWELRETDQKIDLEKIRNSFNECLLNNMTKMDAAKLDGIMGLIQKLLPSTTRIK